VPTADQPYIGNGAVGGATRPGGDDGGAPSGEAGDARDGGGFDGFGQGQIGEDRRQASGQHRLTGAQGPGMADGEKHRHTTAACFLPWVLLALSC
jgi:hypothetical protein